jgi:hypothetical protein
MGFSTPNRQWMKNRLITKALDDLRVSQTL